MPRPESPSVRVYMRFRAFRCPTAAKLTARSHGRATAHDFSDFRSHIQHVAGERFPRLFAARARDSRGAATAVTQVGLATVAVRAAARPSSRRDCDRAKPPLLCATSPSGDARSTTRKLGSGSAPGEAVDLWALLHARSLPRCGHVPPFGRREGCPVGPPPGCEKTKRSSRISSGLRPSTGILPWHAFCSPAA
jgi:hypothetical protein